MLNQTHHFTGFDFSHQTQSLLSHDSGTLYHTTRRSTRPLVKLSLSRRFKKSHQPSSRTSESGSDTIHDLDLTICTVNTDPLTPLMPSPKLTEIWVLDTELDQDQSKSSVSKLSLPRTAEDPTFNSSITARSNSHFQERSCLRRHKTLQDSPLSDQIPWTSEESFDEPIIFCNKLNLLRDK